MYFVITYVIKNFIVFQLQIPTHQLPGNCEELEGRDIHPQKIITHYYHIMVTVIKLDQSYEKIRPHGSVHI